MSSQSDTVAEEALLMELAQLGMGMSRQLHQAALATTDTERLVALATAFHHVGRGVRQSLALKARFAAGVVVTERTARPEASPAAPPRPEVQRQGWNEYERPDWNTRVEALHDADEPLEADDEVCRARIRRDLTVVSRTPTLAALPALRAPAAALAGRAALLGATALRLVDSS